MEAKCLCGDACSVASSEFLAEGVVTLTMLGEGQQMSYVSQVVAEILGAHIIQTKPETRDLRLTGCQGGADDVLARCEAGFPAQLPLNQDEPELVLVKAVGTNVCLASSFRPFCPPCGVCGAEGCPTIVRPSGQIVCETCAVTNGPDASVLLVPPVGMTKTSAFFRTYCRAEDAFTVEELIKLVWSTEHFMGESSGQNLTALPHLVKAMQEYQAGMNQKRMRGWHNLSRWLLSFLGTTAERPPFRVARAMAYSVELRGAIARHRAAVKIQAAWKGYAERRVCHICLETGACNMGCACRGGSAYAHTTCRVEMARRTTGTKYLTCKMCGQKHNGAHRFTLLSALQEDVQALAPGHPERLAVVSEMAQFQSEFEKPEMGLVILKEVAAAMAIVSPYLLFPPLEIALARCEFRADQADLAVTRLRDAMEYSKQNFGLHSPWVPQIQMHVGMFALEMKQYSLAERLFTKVAPLLADHFGEDSEEATHYGTMPLAAARLALNPNTYRARFFEEFERMRRIFGPAHPHTCFWIEFRQRLGIAYATAKVAANYDLAPIFVLKTNKPIKEGELLTPDNAGVICINAARMPPGARWKEPSWEEVVEQATAALSPPEKRA